MRSRSTRHSRAAFSLVELIIVIVIMGIIAAIAVPRMSSAAANSQLKQLVGTTSELDRAINLYIVEHGGLSPAHDVGGGVTDKPDLFLQRLLEATDEAGNIGGPFGPYLRAAPVNPYGTDHSIRTDGAAPGAGAGWRYDSAANQIVPDHAGAAKLIINGTLKADAQIEPK